MKAILVIVMLWPGMPGHKETIKFETMKQCLTVLRATKIHTPQQAAENEWIGMATCKPVK